MGLLSIVGDVLGISKANKERGQATENITNAGSEVYNRGSMTPEEISQYIGSFGLGSFIQNYLQNQMGGTEEQQFGQGGELNQSLYSQILKDTQNPEGSYISSLEPSLQAAEDYINRSAQSRGLLSSGIPIESMGRAGVELSIKDALARMQARQQSLQRAGQLSQYMGSQRQNTLSGLQNLYGTQQQAGLSAKTRQAGQAQAAGQYAAYPYQAMLGSAYGSGAGQSQLGSAMGGVDSMVNDISSFIVNPSMSGFTNLL
jgi:hypothetical protein